jgi:phosphatidylglycerol:prolipoprotein diacylglycerol transferase
MMPSLGQLGPITLHTYTLLLDLALLIGLGALIWQGWRTNGEPARWVDAGLMALIFGIIAARAMHVSIHWTFFVEHQRQIVKLWRGGLDWHGAMVGGLLGLALGGLLRRVRYSLLTDTFAPVLPLCATIIHTGCLMASCGHGREVRSLADYPPLIAAELPDLYGVVAPRLASQLYGAVLGLVLLGVAYGLARLIRRAGLRFWPVLALLGVGAFGIGFTRGDAVPLLDTALGALRLDQALDLGIAGLGIAGTVITAWPGGRAAQPRSTS